MTSTFDAAAQSHAVSGTVSRRQLLRSGGAVTGAAALGFMGSAAAQALSARWSATAAVENLGPANVSLRVVSGLQVGDTFYAGSRNLSPSRVIAFHVPTARVTATHMLGNGNFVQGLAADPTRNVLYAGVTHAEGVVNLYSIALDTGDVSEIAAVPGLSIRDLAVAPDGVLYLTGRPRPHADGPPVYSWDPVTRELVKVAVPEPSADGGRCLVATDTKIYYGCGGLLSGGSLKASLFEIDRANRVATKIPLPAELVDEMEIFELVAFDNLLVLTTINPVREGTAPGRVALLDLITRQWRVVPGYTGRHLTSVVRWDNRLIVPAAPGLDAIDLDTLKVTHLGTDDPAIGGGYLGVQDGVVSGASGGRIWSRNLGTGQEQSHDLVREGAAPGPMLGMSIAADARRVYVAGTGSVDVHDRATGEVTRFGVRGEVKDMLCVGSTLYMGIYNGQGLWRYEPGGTPSQVARLPTGQNRPTDICWDNVNQLVGLSVKGDSVGGGSLCLYEPATGKVASHINPLGNTQVVSAVVASRGMIYIGGETGDLAMWNPVSGKQKWRFPLPFRETSRQLVPRVSSLAIRGNKLFGTTARSLFVLNIKDPAGPKLAHVVNLRALTGAPGSEDWELIVDRDRDVIYAVSAFSVVRINPVNYSLQLLLKDLGGEWFGRAHVAKDPQGRLYTMSGRDLIQITVST